MSPFCLDKHTAKSRFFIVAALNSMHQSKINVKQEIRVGRITQIKHAYLFPLSFVCM